MVSSVRVIARLDIKAPNVVKGINLEGLRVIGDPGGIAMNLYCEGVDEIVYIDIVASLYQRSNILEIVSQAAEEVFVPITVGGGIRTMDDVKMVLRAGADKVAINTAAISNPYLITQVAESFGNQCMVASIQAKRVTGGWWEVYSDNGRERTGRNVLEWVDEVQSLGAGEILLTSVDREGMAKGCDIELLSLVSKKAKVPLIASGGVGKLQDAVDAIQLGGADAIAMAHVFHYGHLTVSQVKTGLREAGISCR